MNTVGKFCSWAVMVAIAMFAIAILPQPWGWVIVTVGVLFGGFMWWKNFRESSRKKTSDSSPPDPSSPNPDDDKESGWLSGKFEGLEKSTLRTGLVILAVVVCLFYYFPSLWRVAKDNWPLTIIVGIVGIALFKGGVLTKWNDFWKPVMGLGAIVFVIWIGTSLVKSVVQARGPSAQDVADVLRPKDDYTYLRTEIRDLKPFQYGVPWEKQNWSTPILLKHREATKWPENRDFCFYVRINGTGKAFLIKPGDRRIGTEEEANNVSMIELLSADEKMERVAIRVAYQNK